MLRVYAPRSRAECLGVRVLLTVVEKVKLVRDLLLLEESHDEQRRARLVANLNREPFPDADLVPVRLPRVRGFGAPRLKVRIACTQTT